jgi:AraC-like DNA-binding protein
MHCIGNLAAMAAYREFGAPAALRGLVRCGWRSRVDSAAAHCQRVLPDGCMDLIWLDGRLVVAGPDRTAFLSVQRPGTVVTGLRFHPGAAPTVLGVPAGELRDRRVPLADVHPALAAHAESLLAGGSPPGTALLTAVRAAAGTDAPEPAVRQAARLLAGGTSVADTADALGWTSRTLHRRSGAAFGYGPATLRRVLRFRAALALAGRGVPAAEVAARTGYADQPHLSREVRALAGVPLSQLLPAGGASSSTASPSGPATTA